jgi:hypothetical protein
VLLREMNRCDHLRQVCDITSSFSGGAGLLLFLTSNSSDSMATAGLGLLGLALGTGIAGEYYHYKSWAISHQITNLAERRGTFLAPTPDGKGVRLGYGVRF